MLQMSLEKAVIVNMSWVRCTAIYCLSGKLLRVELSILLHTCVRLTMMVPSTVNAARASP